jgi:DNA-binding transcriptional ArsR family regulator
MTAESARGDADLASLGAVLADRARCRILLALADGRALPASMLAEEAGVAASTASSHLGRLVDARLVTVEARGRYRYYRLAGPEVGELIEVLGRLAPAEPVRSLRQGTRAYKLRRARTCYDHLAGRLGVAVTARLAECGAIEALGPGPGGPAVGHGSRRGAADDPGYTLSPAGSELLAGIGANLEAGSWVRCCVDWTEQRHHMAGAHGRAVFERLIDLGWIRRAEKFRAVEVTDPGRTGLLDWIGLDAAQLDSGTGPAP